MKVSMGRLVIFGVAFLAAVAISAQQPGDKDKNPPPLPPITPAAGRLVETITGLQGPAFDLAASDELVAVACERDTIRVYRKGVLKDAKTAVAEADAWKGHQGPVVALAYNGGPVLASAG